MKRSDVVFMYQADRQTYADYGATVLAWGGTPTPDSLAAAQGVTFFGSVGMVTEFARYHERFPQTYEQGLCRDVRGQPVRVPWLTDHQHQGIPYWWCCTQQPLFRQFLRERVRDTVKAGAQGVHLDDHLGTAGGLWLGLCFCDRCVAGFRAYLGSLPADTRTRLGITQPDTFDYRAVARDWLAADPDAKRSVTQHPLWAQWTVYQCRAAAALVAELRALAAATAGHPVPLGANAGLLWPRHLSDYQSLDLFSAETDHHAAERRFSDLPLFAYRLADAVQRPYASTASGGDWAFVKAHDLPGLVRGWMALSYAAGHNLMAPHRQWCYTPEKGTHWYAGPKEKFAPLYQFVRRNASLFDDYVAWADLTLVMPHRAFLKQPDRWFAIHAQLTAGGLSYRLALGGDELVDHPLTDADLATGPLLLVPDSDAFLPADRQRLEVASQSRRVLRTAAEALTAATPAVRVQAEGTTRALPRTKPGKAVIHLLNYGYDAARDDVQPLREVKVTMDLRRLGLADTVTARWIAPGEEPRILPVDQATVTVPGLNLWGLLALEPR